MKNLLPLLMLLLIKPAFSQGLILTPSFEVGASRKTQAVTTGISFGVAAFDQSSVQIGVYQKKQLNDFTGTPNFTAVRLSSTVYMFKNFGVSGRTDLTRGEYLTESTIKGAPKYCKCSGKLIGNEPDTRTKEVRSKLYGSLGFSYKYQNYRVFTDVTFNDYDPDAWYSLRKKPFIVETYMVGIAYQFLLQKY